MKRLWLSLFIGSVMAVSALTGCASVPSSQEMAEMETPVAETGTDQAQGEVQPGEPPVNNSPAQRPQLIKRAHLSLRVESVDAGFERVREIVNAQQGDLLSLNDSGERQRSITAELRVPAEKLDATLDALTEVGTVLNRSITTEDVSSQLVDLQARLSNARKSEAALQQLMERSGDISDVLEVSRELSNVRQSIEQMAAAQKNLQAQVSYSTIGVSLQSVIASSPNQPAAAHQLTNAWKQATHSVGAFTTDLLQIGLWLLAYSPYLVILLGGAVVAQKVRQSARNSSH
ncbi:MAG: DUF4349 domain-containing protein [Phormidesmis sp.]